MAVSQGYLDKIRQRVRRNQSLEIDMELTDIIEECRADLQRVGVLAERVADENDKLILGAVSSFSRWKFGLSNEDASANREDYMTQRDELRRSSGYIATRIEVI